MTHTKALKLALELFEQFGRDSRLKYEHQSIYKTIVAIKEALAQPEQSLELVEWRDVDGTGIPEPVYRLKAQPEQEPVAYGMWDTMIGYGGRMMSVRLDKGQDGCTVPLYTTPPQRKPLTRAVVWKLWCDAKFESAGFFWLVFARAIEAAHGIKEKNT